MVGYKGIIRKRLTKTKQEKIMKAYRNTSNPDTPDNGLGYTMWTDDPDQTGSGYGQYAWEIETSDFTPIEELEEKARRAWEKQEENGRLPLALEECGPGLLDEMSPENIIDGAGAWDVPAFAEWFYDYIACPAGVEGIKTEDGAIFFGESDWTRCENND